MASYFDMFIDHLLNQMLSFDISLPFNWNAINKNIEITFALTFTETLG